jgi:hypothetical protein
MGKEHNGGNGKMFDYLTRYDTVLKNLKMTEEVSDFNFILDRSEQDFRVELSSDKKTNLYMVFLSGQKDGRKYLWNDSIEGNTWKTFKVFSSEWVEIRLFLDDNQIYTNTIDKIEKINLNFKLPVLIFSE